MAGEKIDPRKILRGYDGELFDGEGNFLAVVNTFQAQVSINNTDYQPATSRIVVALMTGYSVTLTFTETVVQDPVLLGKLMASLAEGSEPEFSFQGVLRGHDGSEERIFFRYVVPDGAIDLQNVAPGDVLNRSWSWRVNETPDLQSLLGA